MRKRLQAAGRKAEGAEWEAEEAQEEGTGEDRKGSFSRQEEMAG